MDRIKNISDDMRPVLLDSDWNREAMNRPVVGPMIYEMLVAFCTVSWWILKFILVAAVMLSPYMFEAFLDYMIK